MNNQTNYWCEFSIYGGNGKKLRVPYNEINYIIVDSETRQSKLYLKGKPAPIVISSTPIEINSQTQQRMI